MNVGSVSSVLALREVAAELVKETREAQDLPAELTDDSVFEFVAFLIRSRGEARLTGS